MVISARLKLDALQARLTGSTRSCAMEAAAGLMRAVVQAGAPGGAADFEEEEEANARLAQARPNLQERVQAAGRGRPAAVWGKRRAFRRGAPRGDLGRGADALPKDGRAVRPIADNGRNEPAIFRDARNGVQR